MSVIEFLSQPLWQRLGLTLLHFLWQGLAIAALFGLIIRLLRLRRGNNQYVACLLAFLVMITCPVVTFLILDSPTKSPPTPIAATPIAATPIAATPIAATPIAAQDVTESIASSWETSGVFPAEDTRTEKSVASPAIAEPASSIPWRERIAGYLHASLPWAISAWLVGVFVLSMRLLMGFIGVHRWRRRLEPLPENLVQRVTLLADRLGLRSIARVFVSHSAVQAVAIGYFRPMVLLPAAMVTRMPPEMLEAVIAHELAHIRRFDLWINLFQRVAETLLFYHPAVWWLSHRLRSERELCCDELAVEATGRRLTYASTLAQAGQAKLTAAQAALTAGLGRDRRPTLSRVRHVLGVVSKPQTGRFWLAGIITVLVLTALTVPTVFLLSTKAEAKVQIEEKDGELTIYPREGQTGIVAKRIYHDDNGRRIKTVHYRANKTELLYTEEDLVIESILIHKYDQQGRDAREEHYSPDLKLTRIKEILYDSQGQKKSIVWRNSDEVREYEIKYSGNQSISHLYFDDSGTNLRAIRGVIPEEMDLAHGWGEPVNGLTCGIAANKIAAPLKDMLISSTVKNLTPKQVKIAIGNEDDIQMILRDVSGKLVASLKTPDKKKMKDLQTLQAYQAGYWVGAFELHKWYGDLNPGKYTLTIKRRASGEGFPLVSNTLPITVLGKPKASGTLNSRSEEKADVSLDEGEVWGEALNALRMRLTAPAGTTYKRGKSLPLVIEIQNVGDESISFTKLYNPLNFKITDQENARVGVQGYLYDHITTWENRKGSLRPGEVIKDTCYFERLRFKMPSPMTAINLQFALPTQKENPGYLPINKYSNPVTIRLKDLPFKHPLKSGDLPAEWTKDMELVYREGGSIFYGDIAIHIDGSGRLTTVGHRPREEQPISEGRHDYILEPYELNELIRQLREFKIEQLNEYDNKRFAVDTLQGYISISKGAGTFSNNCEFFGAKTKPALSFQKMIRQFLTKTLAQRKPTAHREINESDGFVSRGLSCSIEMESGEYRVGDPVTIEVKIKNTTDKPVDFYYQDLYIAENLIIENQKSEVIDVSRTIRYDWPHPKKFVRLIQPGETFTHKIKGRIKYKFLTADELRKISSRPLLIDFHDVACHITGTGSFTVKLRLTADENTATGAKSFGVDNIWTGTLQSNKVAFNVRPMPRKELEKVIATLYNGTEDEISNAIEVVGANAEKKAVRGLIEIIQGGNQRFMRKAGEALISIQDTSIVPELEEMYEKPAPDHRTEQEYKFVVMNALKNLESKDKANERFLKVLKSDAPYNEIYYAAEQLALAGYEPALDSMIELAKSSDSRRRGVAISTLLIIGHRLQGEKRKLVVEALLDRMKNDPDSRVRKSAVKASAGVGGDSVSADLVKALKDPDHFVAFSAAIYLGTYGSAEALGPLQEYADKLKDEKSIKVVRESIKFIRQRHKGTIKDGQVFQMKELGDRRGQAIKDYEQVAEVFYAFCKIPKAQRESESNRSRRDSIIESYLVLIDRYELTEVEGWARLNVLTLYATSGDMDVAESWYKQLVKSLPYTEHEMKAHIFMGLHWMNRMKDPGKAMKYFSAIPDPRSKSYKLIMPGGHVDFKGKFSSEEEYYISANIRVLKCYLKLGLTDDAKRHKEKLIEAYPEAKDKIEKDMQKSLKELAASGSLISGSEGKTAGKVEDWGAEVGGLRCSVGMAAGDYRVGDPVVIDVKIENTTDKEIKFYYQDLYIAENLVIKNAKGEIVVSNQTAVYNWPHPKEFIRLIKPGGTFTHQIKGRVKCKFVKAEQLSDKMSRPLLIDFGDVACQIKDAGKFTTRLRLEIGEVAVNRAKFAGIEDIWTGTLESNEVVFNVGPMPRKELDRAIETLRKGNDKEIAEAIQVLSANTDKKAVGGLMEIVKLGRGMHIRKAADALVQIQDTSIIPELMNLYDKPAPYAKTAGEFKQIVLSVLKGLEDKQKINEQFVKVLKSGASVDERSYAVWELATANYEPALPVMIELAKKHEPRMQWAAIDALGSFGTRLEGDRKKILIKNLLEIMKNDPDRTVRSRAVGASAMVGGNSVSQELIGALKDPNPWVTSYAATYLGRYGGPEAIAPLNEYIISIEKEQFKKIARESIKFIQQRHKEEIKRSDILNSRSEEKPAVQVDGKEYILSMKQKEIIRLINNNLPDKYYIQKIEENSSPFYYENGSGTAVYLAKKNVRYTKQQYSSIIWLMPAEYQGRNGDEDESTRQMGTPTFHGTIQGIKIYTQLCPQSLRDKIIELTKPSDTLNSGSEEKPAEKTGVNIYLLEDENMDLRTARKKPISQLVLRKKPWISSDDILRYDASSHCIHLRKNISIPLKKRSLRGNPFVVTVDGQRCYLGALWSHGSSFLPESTMPLIYTPDFKYPDDIVAIELLRITSSGSDYKPTEDVRNDRRILNTLRENGQFHGGLNLLLDNVEVLRKDNDFSVRYTYTLTNKDTDNLYVFDPAKMGTGLFHYFTNGLGLYSPDRKVGLGPDLKKVVEKPEKSDKIDMAWFSLLKSGESMTRTVILGGYPEILPDKYECSFIFHSPHTRKLSKDQLQQADGRIWIGQIGANLKTSVQVEVKEEWGKVVDGLQWRISLPSDRVIVGKPIVVNLEFRNVSDKPLRIFKKPTVSDNLYPQLYTSDGGRNAYSIDHNDQKKVKPGETVLIEPGGTYRAVWDDMSTKHTGAAKIKIWYSSPKNTNPEVTQFWAGNLGGLECKFTVVSEDGSIPEKKQPDDVPKQPNKSDLGRLWEELGVEDQARAYRAVETLCTAGDIAVELIDKRIYLSNVGPGPFPVTIAQWQIARSIRTLELIGSDAAKKLLARIVRDIDGTWPSQFAQAALKRLAKQPSGPMVEKFGSNRGMPIYHGFLFLDGKYMPAPYVVERWGVDVYINGVRVERGHDDILGIAVIDKKKARHEKRLNSDQVIFDRTRGGEMSMGKDRGISMIESLLTASPDEKSPQEKKMGLFTAGFQSHRQLLQRLELMKRRRNPVVFHLRPELQRYLQASNPEYWSSNLGKSVSVKGIAVHDMIGARLNSEHGAVWIDDFVHWPKDVVRKIVRVTGTVVQRYDAPVLSKEQLALTGDNAVPGIMPDNGVAYPEGSKELHEARKYYLLKNISYTVIEDTTAVPVEREIRELSENIFAAIRQLDHAKITTLLGNSELVGQIVGNRRMFDLSSAYAKTVYASDKAALLISSPVKSREDRFKPKEIRIGLRRKDGKWTAWLVEMGKTGDRGKIENFLSQHPEAQAVSNPVEIEILPNEKPAVPVEGEELLSLLRAKDAQFDNILLEFATSGNQTLKPFPAWKYPEIAREMGWENEKAEIIPYRFIEKGIVRGPDATFIQKLDRTVKPPEGARGAMSSFQKISNKDNLICDLASVNGGEITGILNISPRGPGANGVSNYLRNIQFALGFGFGKRIKTIERVEHTDAGTELEGTILIWNDDKSRFKLVLDDNLIVRQATIDCNAAGNLTRFEIKTKGTIRKEGFELAKTGTFKGRGETYDVEFLGIQPNLSDELYEELTDMTPEEGTQVNDRVAGRTYFARGGGKIELNDVNSSVPKESSDSKTKVDEGEKRRKRVKEHFSLFVKKDCKLSYIPELIWSDIPVLLELAQNENKLKRMPVSLASSYAPTEGREGMVALWLIETLRQKQVAAMRRQQGLNGHLPFRGMPMNAFCIKGNRPVKECESSLEIHREVLKLYQRWWRSVGGKTPGETAIFCPLEFTDIRWQGWQRWEHWPDIEIFEKVSDAGIVGQRIIREVRRHSERSKYPPHNKARTIYYALKQPALQKGPFTKEMLKIRKIVLHFYDDKGTNIKDKVVFPSAKASEDLLPLRVEGKEEWGKVANGLQCRLLPATQEAEPSTGSFRDKTVYVTYELRNVSDKAMRFLPWYCPLEGVSGNIFKVVDKEGKPLAYRGVYASRMPPTAKSFVTIQPGKTLSRRVGLPYDFTSPGLYRITTTTTAARHDDLSFYYGKNAPAKIAENPDNVWTGKLISNEVTVNIVAGKGPWGEPSKQGLAIRLRSKPGAPVDVFEADLGNKGYGAWMVLASRKLFDLEVDGKKYVNSGGIVAPDIRLEPGRILADIAIPLAGGWLAEAGPNDPLKLTPGKHTIRIGFIAEPADRNAAKPVPLMSNPVEIEFPPTGQETDATVEIQVEGEKHRKRVRELFGRYVRREPIPEEDLTDIYDEIPKFTWPDIPILLELAQSDKELKNMPKSGISSYLQWNGGLEGTVALWLIEGLRQKQVAAMRHIQGTNDKVTANGLPLNPICMKGNRPLPECEKSREIHLEVLELYRRWWRTVGMKTPGEAAIFCPLELSDIRWYGWQRWEHWSDMEIFKKVTDAGIAGQRIIRELEYHKERKKYLPGKKVRTINYALKEPADQKGPFTKEMLKVQKIVLHFYDDKGTNIKDKVVFPSAKASEDLLPQKPAVHVEGPGKSSAVTDLTSGQAEPQRKTDEVRYEGRTIEEWIGQFDGKSYDDRREVIAALVRIGRPVVPAMMEQMKKGGMRASCARGVLRGMGPEAEDAVPWLIKVALDKEVPIDKGWESKASYRENVVSCLNSMTWAREQVIPVLQRIAQDNEDDTRLRRVAVLFLRDIGKEAIPILRKVTETQDDEIQKAAHHMLAQVLLKERGLSKEDYYTPLIEKDLFDARVPEYLAVMKSPGPLGHPHPLTQKIKRLYRQRLEEEPNAQLAWQLAVIIQYGLRNTELTWAAPAYGSKRRWPREDPTENYTTLAEVLQLRFDRAESDSQSRREFGIILAKLRLLQGDWGGMNAMLKELGQEPIPKESRRWLPAPPVDWRENLSSRWIAADESMRSGNCSLEFKIEKDGKGLKGAHFLVKRAPKSRSRGTGIDIDTLLFQPYPYSFGYRAKDRPMTRYAVSDESGIVRFSKLPEIPVKIEVLVPTSNFVEAQSDWELWMEVEPGTLKVAKMYGAPEEVIDVRKPPAVVELKEGETVYYPRLVVRPALGRLSL